MCRGCGQYPVWGKEGRSASVKGSLIDIWDPNGLRSGPGTRWCRLSVSPSVLRIQRHMSVCFLLPYVCTFRTSAIHGMAGEKGGSRIITAACIDSAMQCTYAVE